MITLPFAVIPFIPGCPLVGSLVGVTRVSVGEATSVRDGVTCGFGAGVRETAAGGTAVSETLVDDTAGAAVAASVTSAVLPASVGVLVAVGLAGTVVDPPPPGCGDGRAVNVGYTLVS